MITEFRDKYAWLSNFAPVAITFDGATYASVEHAYMAAKSTDPAWRLFCQQTPSAGAVKKASRRVPLVAGWEEQKVPLMASLLRQKFQQEPYRSLLLATGDAQIQEGNGWHDCFWGVCLKTGEGQNQLGRLIMGIRQTLQTNTHEEETMCTTTPHNIVNFKQYGSVAQLTAALGHKWLYVGRAMPYYGLPASPLGNPFKVKDFGGNRGATLPHYRRWLWHRMQANDPAVMAALRAITPDTVLVCWCAPEPCHAEAIHQAAAWLRTQATVSTERCDNAACQLPATRSVNGVPLCDECGGQITDEKETGGLLVKLTYFKANGRYYTSSEYTTDKRSLDDIFGEVREMLANGKRPGLVAGSEFHVTVEVPAHPHNYPLLILAPPSNPH